MIERYITCCVGSTETIAKQRAIGTSMAYLYAWLDGFPFMISGLSILRYTKFYFFPAYNIFSSCNLVYVNKRVHRYTKNLKNHIRLYFKYSNGNAFNLLRTRKHPSDEMMQKKVLKLQLKRLLNLLY